MDWLGHIASSGAMRHAASLEEFWALHLQSAAPLQRPVDRAVSGGATADRLGFAFAAGYAAALHSMLPSLDAREVASLAATEEGGAHPRAIRTELTPDAEGFRLSGHKVLVTIAGSELLVLAKLGEERGRAKLAVARISRDQPGVRVAPMEPLPFVPEIPHAEITFAQVAVPKSALLPGDGWEDWVKPFRTVEDVHVQAALVGHLLSCAAAFGWARALRERMLSSIAALRTLAAESPSSAAVHLALAGAISQVRELVDAAEPLWESAPSEVRERWRRDRPLLEVAGKARAARRERAWERLDQGK